MRYDSHENTATAIAATDSTIATETCTADLKYKTPAKREQRTSCMLRATTAVNIVVAYKTIGDSFPALDESLLAPAWPKTCDKYVRHTVRSNK